MISFYCKQIYLADESSAASEILITVPNKLLRIVRPTSDKSRSRRPALVAAWRTRRDESENSAGRVPLNNSLTKSVRSGF